MNLRRATRLPNEVSSLLPNGSFLTLEDLTVEQARQVIDACADEIRRQRRLFTQTDVERSSKAVALSECEKRVGQMHGEILKLSSFKAYVHRRLDDARVPFDPSPETNARTGCRIEGRLSWLIAAKARADQNPEGPQG